MPITSFVNYLLIEKKYSKHTVTAYQKDVETFQQFCINEFETKDLTTVVYNQIRNWIIVLVEEEKNANKTVNRKIASLKAFYKFLLKTQQIKVNPLQKHKSLKEAKKVQIPFSEKEMEEVLALLENTNDFETYRNKVIVEMLYATGMRRAELINITLKDIDFVNQTIKVLGKRNKERYVPMLPSLAKSIKEYIEKRSVLATNTSNLFITKKGKKIYDTLVYRIINMYFSNVSTKVKRSPHIIRHSFATHLLNKGADLNSVKELLGHSSLASTQVYTHNSLGELKKIYNKAHPRSDKNS